MKFDDFLANLRAAGVFFRATSAGEHAMLCPAHDDHSPSLHFRRGDNDKVLLHCFAGCSYENIVAALRAKNLWRDNGRAYDSSSNNNNNKEVAVYRYYDENNNYLFEVVRCENKKFYQRRIDPISGEPQLKDLSKFWTLFGLPELVASDKQTPVWIVEGEKDVLRLRSLGAVATCNPGGAGKWRPEYTRFFAGRDVIIVPDNDDVGRMHANTVATSLISVARSIKLVRWPAGSRDGYDVSDYLDEGHSLADIILERFIPMTPLVADGDKKLTQILRRASERDFTEVGLAQMFATYWQDDVIFDCVANKFYRWSGIFWREATVDELARLAIEFVRRCEAVTQNQDEKKKLLRCENYNKIHNIILLSKAFLQRLPHEDDNKAANDILVTPSAWYDLRTIAKIQPQKNLFITQCTSCDVDFNQTPQLWIDFLHDIFANNDDIVRISLLDALHRALGYSLTGHSSEQVFFLLHGEGATGKSTLLGVVSDILGEYARNLPAGTFFGISSYSSATPELMLMRGRRFLTSSESDVHAVLQEARLKAVTGGDKITARNLYSSYTEFRIDGKIWLATNHKPIIKDDTSGIWRRLILLEFNNTVSSEKLDKTLRQKLLNEAPGILAWLMAGAKKWYELGLSTARSLSEAVDRYREENNPVIEFILENFEEAEDSRIPTHDIYERYWAWCEREKIPQTKRLSRKGLARWVRQKFRLESINHRSYVVGARLR